MAEQRLIDANKIKPVHVGYYGKVVDWATIEYAATIDPETLPIVRQLREELEDTKAKLEMAVCDIYSGDAGDCDTCMHGCDYANDCDSPNKCEYKWRGE